MQLAPRDLWTACWGAATHHCLGTSYDSLGELAWSPCEKKLCLWKIQIQYIYIFFFLEGDKRDNTSKNVGSCELGASSWLISLYHEVTYIGDMVIFFQSPFFRLPFTLWLLTDKIPQIELSGALRSVFFKIVLLKWGFKKNSRNLVAESTREGGDWTEAAQAHRRSNITLSFFRHKSKKKNKKKTPNSWQWMVFIWNSKRDNVAKSCLGPFTYNVVTSLLPQGTDEYRVYSSSRG